ncbi:unnamed protein product [Natator depressus]
MRPKCLGQAPTGSWLQAPGAQPTASAGQHVGPAGPTVGSSRPIRSTGWVLLGAGGGAASCRGVGERPGQAQAPGFKCPCQSPGGGLPLPWVLWCQLEPDPSCCCPELMWGRPALGEQSGGWGAWEGRDRNPPLSPTSQGSWSPAAALGPSILQEHALGRWLSRSVGESGACTPLPGIHHDSQPASKAEGLLDNRNTV